MGSACGKEPLDYAKDPLQMEKSKEIDKAILVDKKMKILKLLLLAAKKLLKIVIFLGPGDSGKSTTLKQIRIIHDKGFSEEEILKKRFVIYSNIITGMCSVIRGVYLLNLHIPDGQMMNDADALEAYLRSKTTVDEIQLTDEIYSIIKRLMHEKAIQEVLNRMNEVHIDECTVYFLSHLDRIHQPNYRPTDADILHSRVSTSGVVQFSFFIRSFTFKVFDVGGQKAQRRKWIHVFDDVHAVLFITSLSDYNQNLMEDSRVNRMQDSLELFESICNNEWFSETAMILFLNKKDLFAEKIRTYPLTIGLPEYKGSQEYEACVEYIRKRYCHLNKNHRRNIYTHETCATDTNQIQIVIDSVIDVVIQRTMQKVGIQ